MNCTICQKPIVLRPSAAERAAKDVTGKSAAYYESLFTTHAECAIAARNHGTIMTMVTDLPPTMQELEMLRLRQQMAKTFGVSACSPQTAEYINSLSEHQLKVALCKA